MKHITGMEDINIPCAIYTLYLGLIDMQLFLGNVSWLSYTFEMYHCCIGFVHASNKVNAY